MSGPGRTSSVAAMARVAGRAPGGADPGPIVRLGDLRVGDLLAEGGEGRVHVLPRQPHLVVKLYRRPVDGNHLDRLVAWPARLGPGLHAVVRAASSWPVSVLREESDGSAGGLPGGDGQQGAAVGLLVPRAPRRFTVRHRDGHSRLASLSYLTADPEHRAAAYGLALPRPAGPERVGLVYALARLLAAFEQGRPAAGHGDLSTKNVLWSLQRGPEVFVLDCDSADLFGPDGLPETTGSRRRAMTPNWDDPAVPAGSNPTLQTDRYSLALIFLRVVGAANFPIQARQRAGGPLEVRFPVPPGPGAEVLLDPSSAMWDLCARSLSLQAERPPASAWLRPLESLLRAMGAADLVAAVRTAQGGEEADLLAGGDAGRADWGGDAGSERGAAGTGRAAEPDVVITPERAARREKNWVRVSPAPRYGAAPGRAGATAAIGYRATTLSNPRARQPNPASAQPRTGSPGGTGAWVRPSTLNQPWLNQPPGGLAAPPGGAPGSAPPSPWLSAGASAPIWPELRDQLVRFIRWLVAIHRAMGQAVTGRARTRRLRTVVACLAVDFAIAVLAGSALALIVSPIVQN